MPSWFCWCFESLGFLQSETPALPPNASDLLNEDLVELLRGDEEVVRGITMVCCQEISQRGSLVIFPTFSIGIYSRLTPAIGSFACIPQQVSLLLIDRRRGWILHSILFSFCPFQFIFASPKIFTLQACALDRLMAGDTYIAVSVIACLGAVAADSGRKVLLLLAHSSAVILHPPCIVEALMHWVLCRASQTGQPLDSASRCSSALCTPKEHSRPTPSFGQLLLTVS